MLGPLQLIVMRCPPGDAAPRRVLDEVDHLQGDGAVRLLDVLLMTKDWDGNLVPAPIGDSEDFGALVSTFLPVAGDGEAVGAAAAPALTQALTAGTTVAFLLVEHRWARGLLDALDREGGAVLGADLLTPGLRDVVDAEVDAMDQAAATVAAAQAAEADARLRAVAAQAEADEAVAAAVRIRSAAAAAAIRALIDAGLVERAATHEAADALHSAGLIIAAANASAERAVDADEATVAEADEATDEALAEDATLRAAADEKTADSVQAASVTPAEIRVLRYLSTPLTFAFIADKLGISRGAAKSRAERAYRKLGVHSRADAVERARKLRVVP